MKHRILITNWKIIMSIVMFVLLVTALCPSGLNAFETHGNEYRVEDQPNGFFIQDTENVTGYTLFTPASFTTTYFADESVEGSWLLRIYDSVTNGLGGYLAEYKIDIYWKF